MKELGYAQEHEIGAKIVLAPRQKDILKVQGYEP